MKECPMVTVWMPCYNHERYVRESIESVLSQTYKDFEFIIVENGSTDHSRDIIKEYEDKATVICFDKNDPERVHEVIAQRARGKYCAEITSDDIWMPDKLEKQVVFLEEHPEYQACFAWAEYGDESMEPIYDYTYTLFKQDNRTSAEWIKYFWQNGNCLCAPSVVMKTQEHIDIHKKGCGYWQLFDLGMWIRFLMKERQLYVFPEVLVKMRKHNTAISFSACSRNRALEESAHIRMEIMEQIPDKMFLEGFGMDFLRPDCKGHEELMCEKILLLFRAAENDAALQTRAFDFFYKHYPDDKVVEVLKEKYNMGKLFFGDFASEMGTQCLAERYYRQGVGDTMEELRGEAGSELNL